MKPQWDKLENVALPIRNSVMVASYNIQTLLECKCITSVLLSLSWRCEYFHQWLWWMVPFSIFPTSKSLMRYVTPFWQKDRLRTYLLSHNYAPSLQHTLAEPRQAWRSITRASHERQITHSDILTTNHNHSFAFQLCIVGKSAVFNVSKLCVQHQSP